MQVLLLPGSQEIRVCLRAGGSADAGKRHSREKSGEPVCIPGLAPTLGHVQGGKDMLGSLGHLHSALS